MKIYNSLTRKKEEFTPIKAGNVGIYVCGPTVYDSPHIGHARSAYIFDVIRRYLEYRGCKVKFVRNVTDVDDKIIEKAKKAAKSTNLVDAAKEISKKYLNEYHADMELLGISAPDKEPKATEYIPKMIKFISLLIARDAAYEAGGDVYFDIKRAKDYGKLSNQNLEKMEVGARIASGEKKRDPLDFALWKSSKEGEPSWPSPWGNGRPGWHVECSVMSSDILGDEFDIHGGGIDLIFPHHENEIAQSEGAGKKFARYWIHNGLLTINSEKMAKSLGNFISIKDFIAKHRDTDLLKVLFLGTHYRHPVDYTEEKIIEAAVALRSFNNLLFFFVDRVEQTKRNRPDFGELQEKIDSGKFRKIIETYKDEFIKAMDDDFNMPEALAALFKLRDYTWAHANPLRAEIGDLKYAKGIILELGNIFGLFLKEGKKIDSGLQEYVETKIKERNAARAAKDFKRSDEIRSELLKKDIILEDTKDGTTWRRKI